MCRISTSLAVARSTLTRYGDVLRFLKLIDAQRPPDPSGRCRAGQPIGAQGLGDNQVAGAPRSPTVAPHQQTPTLWHLLEGSRSRTRDQTWALHWNKDPKTVRLQGDRRRGHRGLQTGPRRPTTAKSSPRRSTRSRQWVPVWWQHRGFLKGLSVNRAQIHPPWGPVWHRQDSLLAGAAVPMTITRRGPLTP